MSGRVVVAGGVGTLGDTIALRLAERGWSVALIAPSGTRCEHPRVRSVQCEVSEVTPAFFAQFDPTWVVHAAGVETSSHTAATDWHDVHRRVVDDPAAVLHGASVCTGLEGYVFARGEAAPNVPGVDASAPQVRDFWDAAWRLHEVEARSMAAQQFTVTCVRVPALLDAESAASRVLAAIRDQGASDHRDTSRVISRGDSPALRVLIPSAGSKVSLVRQLRSAARALDISISVTIADLDPECPASLVADDWIPSPRVDGLETVELVEWVLSGPFDLVVPSRDAELALWSAARRALEEHGVSVAVSSSESIAVCTDKLRFSRWCEERALPVIRSATNLSEIDGDDVVVKDRHGAGSRSVHIGVSRRIAAVVAEEFESVLYQPHVIGPEFSADFFVSNDGSVHGPLARERVRVVAGEASDTRVVGPMPVFTALARTLVDDLGYRGPGCAQAIQTGEGLVLMEVNARFGGASAASAAAGLSLARLVLGEATGVPMRTSSAWSPIRLVRSPVDRVLLS